MLLSIAMAFLKLGLFAIGGGAASLKLIEEEIVEGRGWVTHADFAAMVGGSYLFPGLTAVKVAGFIGQQVAGVSGLLIATIAFCTPGLVLGGVGFAWLMAHRTEPHVAKLITALQYAGVALMLAATWSLAINVLGTPQAGIGVAGLAPMIALALALLLFVAVAWLNLNAFVALVVFLLIFMSLPLKA